MKSKSNVSLKKKQSTFKLDEYVEPEPITFRQQPITYKEIDKNIEKEDNKLRKYVQKKAEIAEALKKNKSTHRQRRDRNAMHNDRVVTGVAYDSHGHVMKIKKGLLLNLLTLSINTRSTFYHSKFLKLYLI